MAARGCASSGRMVSPKWALQDARVRKLSSRTAMLNVYPKALTEGLSLSSRDLAHRTWFDLVDPTEAERSAFERASGLRVPSKNELGEIEATSRLQIKNDALYMTAPMIFAAANEPWLPTPVGFVLSKQLLLTVRSAKSAAFDAAAKDISAAEKP